MEYNLSKVDSKSGSVCGSGFSLFDVSPTSVSTQRSHYIELQSTDGLSPDGPFTFRVLSDVQWIDLSKTYILMQLRIEKMENNAWHAITENDPIAPVCLLGKTFFKQFKVSLQNTQIYDSGGNLHGYRSWLETELNYPQDTKKNYFQVCGYTPTTGQGDWLEYLGGLNWDLANQSKYLLNNSDVTFTFYRNSNEFLLNSQAVKANDTKRLAPQYRINVRSMRLFVKVIDAFPSLNSALSKRLSTTPAIYNMRRLEGKSVYVAPGRVDTPENALFMGKIPRRLIAFFVDAGAFNGDIRRDPFFAEHCSVIQATVTAGGIQYPHAPYSLDFDKQHVARAFYDMYDGLSLVNEPLTNCISLTDFCSNGLCFFIFNLSPNMDDSGSFELVRHGATSVHFKFAKPIPPGGMQLICFAEFDSVMQISQDHVTVLDDTL